MAYGIEVEVESNTLEVGQSTTIRVTALSDTAVNCQGVLCEVLWETKGRGDTDRGVVYKGVESGGMLSPGEPMVASFEVRIPLEGPVTYHGKLLVVEWKIRVSLDIPWRFDPKREIPLRVIPRGAYDERG